MLVNIVSYWFVSLPAVITGLLLMKLFKEAIETKQSEKRVPARIRQRK